MGWVLFYAAWTKIQTPGWSSAGYLKGAQTFVGFYDFLLQPGFLPIVNFFNQWGVLLVGAALILGIFVRLSSFLGALLMILYYLPVLSFPYIKPHSFLVDEHIVYALALLVLGGLRAGQIWGLENWCKSLPICSRYPRLRNFFG